MNLLRFGVVRNYNFKIPLEQIFQLKKNSMLGLTHFWRENNYQKTFELHII